MFFTCRVQIKVDGRKRKLIIKDAKVTDAGMYSCVSNADKTEAELIVNCKIFYLPEFYDEKFQISCMYSCISYFQISIGLTRN